MSVLCFLPESAKVNHLTIGQGFTISYLLGYVYQPLRATSYKGIYVRPVGKV